MGRYERIEGRARCILINLEWHKQLSQVPEKTQAKVLMSLMQVANDCLDGVTIDDCYIEEMMRSCKLDKTGRILFPTYVSEVLEYISNYRDKCEKNRFNTLKKYTFKDMSNESRSFVADYLKRHPDEPTIEGFDE